MPSVPGHGPKAQRLERDAVEPQILAELGVVGHLHRPKDVLGFPGAIAALQHPREAEKSLFELAPGGAPADGDRHLPVLVPARRVVWQQDHLGENLVAHRTRRNGTRTRLENVIYRVQDEVAHKRFLPIGMRGAPARRFL
ncbi:MAG: hypothetical protein ACREKI_08280 [Gemmatimonadota bacterium]